MPRNITVTLADGSTHVYRGAPDNVTPDQVMARARKEFGQDVHALDGGKNPGRSPVPVVTKRQDLAAAAPQKQQPETWGGWLKRQAMGVAAGVNNAAYNVPNRIGVAAAHPIDAAKSLVGGQDYGHELNASNRRWDAAGNAAPVANILSTLGASLATGAAEAKGISAGARMLSSSSRPVIAHAGNVLEALTQFKRGQTARNIGRSAAVGAASGAAQAAGQGTDVGTGTEAGAIAGGGLHALGAFVGRPAMDVLGLTKAGGYLRRFTNATVDELKAKAAAFRKATGAEPTLFELLPAADRQKLTQNTIAGRPNVEQAADAIKARTANIPAEMSDTVRAATEPQQRLTQRQMLRSLADANGGTPVSGDAALALKASKSPTDMLALRREESRRIMAPHDDTQVVDGFDDLIPTHFEHNPGAATETPTGVLGPDGKPIMKPATMRDQINQIETDPEVSKALRSVAGGLPRRPDGEGVTVRDITNMISDLRDDAAQGGIDGRAAARAAEHLMDVISTNVPEAAEATTNMRNAFSAHSRMAEGMGEGWQQRLRDEIQVGTNGGKAQGVHNAFDTDEGTAGRQLGQTNRLNSDLGVTGPNDLPSPKAVSTVVDLGRNGNPALAPNLGQNAADKIQAAATAQSQSAEALASGLSSAQNGDGTALEPDDLAKGLLALNPHSFAATKAHWAQRILQATWLPKAKAAALTDMLFSQDPVKTNKAISLLNTSENGRGLLSSLTAGNLAGDASAERAPPPSALPAEGPPSADETPAPPLDVPPVGVPGNPSGYVAKLQDMYNNEDPAFVDLVERVAHRESGGKQTDKDGKPITSKAGAVGVMQVEPYTAPEAAKLAGVPWDPEAYKNDPAYNKLIGAAYLGSMLHRYDGSVPHALAAYNAGPGRVDNALNAAQEDGNWVAHLPQETQDYVSALG